MEISKGLRLAIVLSFFILAIEIAGGILSNSLALLSDSGHVFLDMFALGLSYYAVSLAMRPPTEVATYGLHRAEVLASLVNGLSLIVVASLIFFFAYGRLLDPPHVQGSTMLIIAVIGLAGNMYVAYRIHDYKSLNVRSAYLHVLGDTLSSVAVIVGGIAIQLAQTYWIDPALSFMIAAVIAVGAIRIFVESADILLEKVPRHLAPDRLEREIRGVGGVKEVHDLHVWSICSGHSALSAHVVIADQSLGQAQDVMHELKRCLQSGFGVEHTTIQFECARCEQGAVMYANDCV